jgi:hypothetical protein
MTAKRKDMIENWLLFKQARLLRQAGFVSHQDIANIKATTPLPKTSSNILVRFGFFFLGCTLYSSILGFISIFLPQGEINYPYVLLFFSFIGCAIAEGLSHFEFHNFGLDDAFIFLFQMMFCGALGVITESPTLIFVLLAALGAFCCYRYYSTGSMVLSLIGVSSLASSPVTVHKILDPVFLPFLLLVIAAAFLLAYNQFQKSPKFRLYPRSIHAIKVFALVLAYLAVNYVVYEEAYQDLKGLKTSYFNNLPLSPLFYALTILLPLLYVFLGIKKKDKTYLHIGIVAAFASIITLKHFHNQASIESYLVCSGAALILAPIVLIKKLRNKQTGTTFLLNKFDESTFMEHTQTAAVVAQGTVSSGTTNPNSFGGGDFSGGGSSGNY